MSNIMIQQVSNQTNQSIQLPQGTTLNQPFQRFSNVHNNQTILSPNQQVQTHSGMTGVAHHLSDSQNQQMAANPSQLYGFQQSNHPSPPIYSTDYSIQTNISGPNLMHQSVQQPHSNSNQQAYEQVNQLKQLHQRLLMQQMSNEQKPQTVSTISSFIPTQTTPISARPHSGLQNDKISHSGHHGLSENLAQLLQQDVPLRAPQQVQQPIPSADEVSTNINQKLIQLKEQLEKQQQIQKQRPPIAGVSKPSGETKLQMQLRQHIKNQQKKSDKNSSSSNGSSGRNSPKSQGGKREAKQIKKGLNGYSSGESSTSSSKMGHTNTVPTKNLSKRTFNQSSMPQDLKAMNIMPVRAANAQQPQAQKMQMYDHQTEQKRRRLLTASFRQNQVFHTSGNRLVPVLPLSILGVKSSSKL